MTGVVIFNYATWAGQYPELSASVGAPQAQGYFNQASLYLDNTTASIVTDATVGGPRETILYMLTSHIAALLAPVNGNAPNPLVGRISAGTQGSVNVTTELRTPGSAAWFEQTKYGLLAWQALAPYRTALYVAAPCYPFGRFGGPVNPFSGALSWP